MEMKKKKAMMNLLKQGNEEKKITFLVNGEKVEYEIFKSPARNEFFARLTTYRGQQKELSFPIVLLTKNGIQASRHCGIGKNIKLFIAYIEINPKHLVTELQASREDLL